MAETDRRPAEEATEFVRGLGFWDCAMVVAGSMIGSGIFIVPADIARLVGSGGWLLLVWVFTGLLTLAAALSYGELAAMMPRAGGHYVYLREAYSPLWGFLYGWTFFLVIQTGTIAAVAIAFSRFLGVLAPAVSPTSWLVEPIHISSAYAVSLSTQQAAAILLIALLTYFNTRGLELGRWIQNTFTTAKTLALAGVIALGILAGLGILASRYPGAGEANFSAPWTPAGTTRIQPDLDFLSGVVPPALAGAGAFGLLVAFCVAQVGSLFSADAWHSIASVAGEVRNPRRTIPLALVVGSGGVLLLYVLANLSYLLVLPLSAIQNTPDDRVGSAALEAVFPAAGGAIMAAAIMVSTFGCNNGLILTGARVYYAMARDGLFFRPAGHLNAKRVPAVGLVLQGVWASLLVLPRTRLRDAAGAPALDAATSPERYGNVYSSLLDYVVFAVLIFYALTIAGVFILRWKRPGAERPYRAVGYPLVPALYVAATGAILLVLLVYRTQTTWPGLAIVIAGVPVYFLRRGKAAAAPAPGAPEGGAGYR